MREQQQLQECQASAEGTGEVVNRRRAVAPRVRRVDREGAVELVLELPGVQPDGVQLETSGRQLTVTATRTTLEPEGMRTLYSELRDVDFRTGFRLPVGIDASGIRAQLDAGLLKVTLPWAAPERKVIPVAVQGASGEEDPAG